MVASDLQQWSCSLCLPGPTSTRPLCQFSYKACPLLYARGQYSQLVYNLKFLELITSLSCNTIALMVMDQFHSVVV